MKRFVCLCNGFYLVLLGFTRFHWFSMVFSSCYGVLPSFTGFYGSFLVHNGLLPCFIGFYLVLLGFTRFHWFSMDFFSVLCGFT